MSKIKKNLVIEYYQETPIFRFAAMYAGISEDTLLNWRKADSAFSDRLDRARAKWVTTKVKKAKVEFALERMEREIFGQKLELEAGENLVKTLLEAYGITEGMKGGTKVDELVQGSSDSSS